MSWTVINLERRFYRCRHYKDKEKTCGFFDWHNKKISKRAKDVINALKRDVVELTIAISKLQYRRGIHIREIQ